MVKITLVSYLNPFKSVFKNEKIITKYKPVVMGSLHPDLLLIMDKFPGQSDRIDELYENDPDFKTLCADYYLCMNFLHKHRHEFSEKKSTIKEYEDMRSDLEKELHDFIRNKK